MVLKVGTSVGTEIAGVLKAFILSFHAIFMEKYNSIKYANKN